MLNNVVVVGRIVSDLKINETEDNKKNAIITLAVPRVYQNKNGEYDTDFIPCVLWSGIAENTINYCKKGDMIGVKGRIQSKKVDRMVFDKVESINEITIVAEKVTFLSSGKEKDE